ncbi:MAG: helix-turn-helix domain-containing protein [Acidimicrobiales bacterium]
MPAPATYTVAEVAELVGISDWAVRQAAARGDTPVGRVAIRVGRRIVWPRAAVDRLLGVGDGT